MTNPPRPIGDPTTSWRPDSWSQKPILQQPTYDDSAELAEVLQQLARLPPLVTSWEIETLRSQLAEATEGKRFLLQGGDCSENFEECDSDIIAAKLKILLQMSLVLVHGSRMRVIRVGRFAGQYAKPRTDDMETRDGVSLPSYRGDMINRLPFNEADRKPNPQLLLRGYERAGLTINFIRSLIDGGFADLHHPENWELNFVANSPHADRYREMVRTIRHSLQFFETLVGRTVGEMERVDFFTSHEGLHLLYEQAQTRFIPRVGKWFNLSTHYPWIGDRTRDPGGAHVEFFRGIQNPIGVKVGPTTEPEELKLLIDRLNPHNEAGRLTLIHRFGADLIDRHLPSLIEAARACGKTVLWCCDPMHGNTETRSGFKTRQFNQILKELELAFDIHSRLGTRLGGVHFELTGENVTECVGGAGGLTEADLSRSYKTQVDPRLNYEQALEMAMLIAERMVRDRKQA